MSDEMKSMAEALADGGWKPREGPRRPVDYQRIIDEAWATEKPRLWDYMLRNGVPPKHVDHLRHLRIEGWDAVHAVEQFLKTPEKLLLVLVGGNQVGKSLGLAYGLSTRTVTLATQFGGPQTEWMKSQGIAAEPTMQFRRWNTDFMWIKANTLSQFSGGSNFDPEKQKMLRKLESVGLLVIDEVGGESYGDVVKKLDDLIGKRWDSAKHTMMTSNLDLQGLRAALGDRVVERIKRVGMVVECRSIGEVAA